MLRGLFYILLAFIVSGLGNVWITFRESASADYHWGYWLAATVFGIVFQELVVTRLPIFREHYRSEGEYPDVADRPAALFSALIAAGVALLMALLLGLDRAIVPHIMGASGFSAGTYSWGCRR